MWGPEPLQAAAILFYLTVFLLAGPLTLTGLICLLVRPATAWIPLCYAVWWLWDLQVCNRGGRRGRAVHWVRGWKLWQLFRDYFPVKLVRTAPLPPSSNYLVCSHPHGVLCFGASCAFASEACGWADQFQGLTPHITTIEGNLWMPLFREFFLLFGAVSSSKRSLNWLLSRPGGGEAPVLLVGGVPEMVHTGRRDIHLVLAQRKGFIKLALRHGASLVPSFSFGESETYSQVRCCRWLAELQLAIRKRIGISPVLFHGRGILQSLFGLLPHRSPITVVVGRPLAVERVADPSQEQIDRLHQRYIAELTSLYRQHNPLFGDPNRQLVIE